MPEANVLKAIRQEIDYNSTGFHTVVDQLDFKKYFGGLDTESQLKKAPKGYVVDHPDISYLKLKSFVVTHSLSQSDLTQTHASKKIVEGFQHIYPFIKFLRNAIA